MSTVINKVNSLLYALRYINSKLSRQGLKKLIHAHMISRQSYGSQIWSGCTSSRLSQRVRSCYFKFIKLYCKDFRNKLNRKELLERSELRSLDSFFKVQACKLVHSVCLNLVPEQLALSVLSRGYYSTRFPNRTAFFRRNTRRVGLITQIDSICCKTISILTGSTCYKNFSVKKLTLLSRTFDPNHF